MGNNELLICLIHATPPLPLPSSISSGSYDRITCLPEIMWFNTTWIMHATVRGRVSRLSLSSGHSWLTCQQRLITFLPPANKVFTHVCLLTRGSCMWPLPIMHWTSMYRPPLLDIRPSQMGPLPQHQTWDPWPLQLTSGGHDWRLVQTCSFEDPSNSTDIWWPKHVWFASEWYASYWKAFLFFSLHMLIFGGKFGHSWDTRQTHLRNSISYWIKYKTHNRTLAWWCIQSERWESWCLCVWMVGHSYEWNRTVMNAFEFFTVNTKLPMLSMLASKAFLQKQNKFTPSGARHDHWFRSIILSLLS